jgi:mannose-6-phosphate isomerase-like protein (cupin superfamily)
MPDARYSIDTQIRFGPLETIDVAALAAAMRPWSNQTLVRVNESVVRLGVIEGDFHWHTHEREDEFFYVLEGSLSIELRDRPAVRLGPGMGYVVPRGVEHMTRAAGRTAILMVEAATVTPTGD